MTWRAGSINAVPDLESMRYLTLGALARTSLSCLCVRRFIRDVFGVIVPVVMMVLLLILVFWMGVELSAAFTDLYAYVSQKREGAWMRWRTVSLAVALAQVLLVCTMGILLTLANRAALGRIAHQPLVVVLQEQAQGAWRTRAASRRSREAARDAGREDEGEGSRDKRAVVAGRGVDRKADPWGSKFPAFSKALHDHRLPWGAIVGGVENIDGSMGASTSLSAGGGAGHDQTWAGAVFRELGPLKIANTYESNLLPSWKSGQEGVNKWGGERTEVELQSSADPDCEGGDGAWDDIHLRYAIGSILRPPSWSGLHVARLDWHLLSQAQHDNDWRSTEWFVTFMAKLLARPVDVMSLLAFENRIRHETPMCVRATLYNYELARHNEFAFISDTFGAEFAKNDFEGGQGDGAASQRPTWWFRTKLHDLTPPLTEELFECSPKPDCLPEGEQGEQEGGGRRRRLMSLLGTDREMTRRQEDGLSSKAAGGAHGLLADSLASLDRFTGSIEEAVMRHTGRSSGGGRRQVEGGLAHAARVADPEVLHEKLPRETIAEEAQEKGSSRVGRNSGQRGRRRPSRNHGHELARRRVELGGGMGDGSRGEAWSGSGRARRRKDSTTAPRGQLAGVVSRARCAHLPYFARPHAPGPLGSPSDTVMLWCQMEM